MADKIIIPNEELMAAFTGTNFGHTQYRELLNASVFKKLVGYHCGHTITQIMKELGLIGLKTEKPTKKGLALIREVYGHLMIHGG